MEVPEIIIPPPTPLTIFSAFYPLPVKLKWSLFQQNWSVTIIIEALTLRILTLETIQGTKDFKSPRSVRYSDMVIFWFNKMIKQNI